jgi:DNA topoisomerase-1
MLKAAGISEEESEDILTQARVVYYGQVLKDIGIPAVSLKKYVAAGITCPESFCTHSIDVLSKKTGMSPGTVQRHVDLVCTYLKRPVPKKYTKLQVERGRKELLKIRGITPSVVEKLVPAGIINATLLLESDADTVAAETGIPAHTIREYQAAIQKKRDTAVIQI